MRNVGISAMITMPGPGAANSDGAEHDLGNISTALTICICNIYFVLFSPVIVYRYLLLESTV